MSITEFKKQFAQRQIPAQLEELWVLQDFYSTFRATTGGAHLGSIYSRYLRRDLIKT